jgi:hypothetical protein
MVGVKAGFGALYWQTVESSMLHKKWMIPNDWFSTWFGTPQMRDLQLAASFPSTACANFSMAILSPQKSISFVKPPAT